jgi:cytochrome c
LLDISGIKPQDFRSGLSSIEARMTLVRLQILAVALLASNVCIAQSKSPSERGKTLFRASCGACHSVTCNRQGPKLEGLFGRPAGSVSDFQQYTPELKASGIVWTDETLNAFLADPNKLVPGTAMSVVRVANAKDRKDLIDYMRREDRAFELCPKS